MENKEKSCFLKLMAFLYFLCHILYRFYFVHFSFFRDQENENPKIGCFRKEIVNIIVNEFVQMEHEV